MGTTTYTATYSRSGHKHSERWDKVEQAAAQWHHTHRVDDTLVRDETIVVSDIAATVEWAGNVALD